MTGPILTRIALSGRLRGSAKLEESAGRTRITLSLSERAEGLYLLLFGRSGFVRTNVENMRAEAACEGVCAMAVCRGGVLASGFTGACRADRERLLSEMRIMAAGDTAESSAAPAKQPGHPVTERILEQARKLFGPAEKPKQTNEPEAVPNPFPRTFPNSVWEKRPGEETLYGSVTIGGRKRKAAAYPLDLRQGGAVAGRFVRARDGRAYRIELIGR